MPAGIRRLISAGRWTPAIAVTLVAACQPAANSSGLAAAFEGSSGTWVDLSHDYSAETIYWPTDSLGFRLDTVSVGDTPKGYFYSAFRFATAEHGGTHLDAPYHFNRNGWTADAIPLDHLIGPAVVIDVSDHVTPDYQVTVDDIQAFEAANTAIPDGAIVLIRTGWGPKWPDRATYLGTTLVGEAAIPELHFPGLDPETTRWLVENRRIAALGIDTPSIDYGQSKEFGTHVALYGANIPGFENIANMDKLPATGSFVVALPMKIKGGSGGPLRAVAFVPK